MSKHSKSENIYSLKGFGEVFRFTCIQNLKNKSVLIELLFVILILVIMTPIMYLINGNQAKSQEKKNKTKLEALNVKRVLVNDKTGIGIGLEDLDLNSAGLDAECEISALEKVEAGDECLLVFDKAETGYTVTVIYSDDTVVNKEKIKNLAEYAQSKFDEYRLKKAGIDNEKIALINKGMYSSTVSEEDYISEKNSMISDTKLMAYLSSFIVLIFVVISLVSSYIVISVSQEKTSKLAESILVSVRPMALLVGKVASMIILIFLAVVIGSVGSYGVRKIMVNVFNCDPEKLNNVTSMDFGVLFKFGIKGSIVCFVGILLAFCVYGIIAGLMGSTCNKTEDIQSANGAVMIISFVGYIGSFVLINNTMIRPLIALVPPFSLFCAPILYLTGRIALWMLLVSFAIQIVVLVLLTMLAARIYKGLLLSGNSVPGFKTIIKALKG